MPSKKVGLLGTRTRLFLVGLSKFGGGFLRKILVPSVLVSRFVIKSHVFLLCGGRTTVWSGMTWTRKRSKIDKGLRYNSPYTKKGETCQDMSN